MTVAISQTNFSRFYGTDGTLTAPSYTWLNSPTIGFYRQAPGVVGLSGGLKLSGALDNNAQIQTNVGGTWTASGTWTIPAVTLGGDITINSAVNIAWKDGGGTARTTLRDDGAGVYLNANNGGYLRLQTNNGSGAGDANLVARLNISGTAATAVATWSNVTLTGIKITSGETIEFAGIPTSNPGAGKLWSNSGVITLGT